MWYFILFLCLIFAIIIILIFTKWSFAIHVLPENFELSIKVLCFTKKIDFSSLKSTKKQNQHEQVQKKKKDIDITEKEANIEPDKEKENPLSNLKLQIEKFQSCKAKILAYKNLAFQGLSSLRYRIEIQNTYIRLDYGSGDPAATGQTVGYLWTGIGILYPLINQYFLFDFPIIDVTPDFYQKRLDYEVKSIINVKPVHIIKTLFVLVFNYFKYEKDKGSVTNG